MKTKKQRYLWIGIFTALIMFAGLWRFYQVYASTTSSYWFNYPDSGTKLDITNPVHLKSPVNTLYIGCEEGFEPGSVSWVSSNTDAVVVTPDATNPTIARLERMGPGYSKITATVEDDGRIYTLTCTVMVDFSFDKKDLPFLHIHTTETGDESKVMVLDKLAPDTQDAVVLRYENDEKIDPTVGKIVWESKDNSVVNVDSESGVITVVGAGETEIEARTVSTREDPLKKTFRIIVNPKVQDPKSGTPTFESKINVTETEFNSPLRFKTNAESAAKLEWVVYDTDFNIVPEGRVTYNTDSEYLVVTGAKYGSYIIRGYINGDYKPVPISSASTVGFIEIKLDVDMSIANAGGQLIMNVGDTYSIMDNSNIPTINTLTYFSTDQTVAEIDNTGVIKALDVGETDIKLTVTGTSQEYIIHIKVIDGIALNYSKVKIYTSGTIKLIATVTNTQIPVVWTSDNPQVASVTDGLVTGVSEGKNVRITASQNINGVIKSATCLVDVQPSVNKITINPESVTLDKGESATLNAEIEPVLNNVSLKWMSSNDDIVKIDKSYDLSATIVGAEAGTAVITAINQENVVVGYCQVTVKEKVSKVSISESAVTLSLSKKNYQLSAYVTPSNATNKKINWTSTNTKVATVDSNGLVTLISGGTASIIAASDDNPAATAICNITVEISASALILDDKTKTLYVGDTYRIGYVLTPTNAANKDIKWSSSSTSVVSVDTTGLIKAVGAGQAIITARTEDGALTATCTITVKQKATGISIDVSDLELYVNQSYDLNATVTPADSNDYTLTWESSNTTVATVDDNGTVSAVAAGRSNITVKTSSGQVATCTVTVKEAATGLQLNYKEKTIVIGEKFTIKASVVPSSAADEVSVTWSSSKASVAAISSTGVVTGIKGGTAVITCKSDDGKFTEFCVVTVVERVTSVTLNKSNIPVGLKKTYTLKATVKTNAATIPAVRWTSSNTKIASVNSKGKVTGKALGKVTITATARDGSGEKDTCIIRVVRQATSLSLNKTSVTTVEGRTFKLTATVKPKNASYKTVRWTSSDEDIAIVDSSGNVTALSDGNVTIKATTKDNSGKTAVCFVIVQPRTPANSVTIINQNLTMVVGETTTIQKAINPSASTDRVTWQSDNKTVASVDSSSGKVTARTPGIASVTVMTESGKTATTKITVVGLNTNNLVLEQYTNYRLSVIGINGGITWDVDDNDIAVVTNGLVSSRRVGSTTITATVNGRRLTCRLKVVKIR